MEKGAEKCAEGEKNWRYMGYKVGRPGYQMDNKTFLMCKGRLEPNDKSSRNSVG